MKDWEAVFKFLEKNNVSLPTNIREYSDEEVILAMNMGFKCLEYLKTTSLDEKIKYELKAKDEALRTTIECVVHERNHQVHEIETKNIELNKRIEDMESVHTKESWLIRLQIKEEIEKEIELKCSQQNHIVVTSLQEQIGNLKDTFHSLKEDRDGLQKRFDELNQKLPHMNMVAMGNIGQDIVEQLTRETFNYECDIVPSSNEKHCMDIRLSTPNGFNANLEIKAADPIQTVRDVQKFHRDLHELIDKSEINASALISLKAPIPNFKSGTLVFKTNAVGLKIPVLYIQVTSKELLKHCLLLLKDVQQVCQFEHDARGSQPVPLELEKYQEEKKILKKILPDIFRNNIEEEDDLTSQLDHIKRVKEISENRLAKLQLVRQCKTRLLDEIPWLFDESCQKTNKLDKAIAIWEKFKLENKKDPERLSCFGTDEPFIKNIGFARLKEAVRENRKREKLN